ncbi:MAG: hypothetical protein AABW83_01775 [Nanoarchaeota archaeon]
MKISQIKKDKITEQIVYYLYQSFPNYPFTSEIAREIARDEEFIKQLLFELKEKNIVVPIKKDNNGIIFKRRIRWKLSNKIYDFYHSKQ